MRAGSLLFAVYTEEVETVVPWSRPSPLPHAPAAVLGVVPARGRMRTVLDPVPLLRGMGRPSAVDEGGDAAAREAYGFVACLRGDEQLALAFESAERAHLGAGEPPGAGSPDDLPARGAFERGGETVLLLDPAQLFAAALRGTERRRPRRAR